MPDKERPKTTRKKQKPTLAIIPSPAKKDNPLPAVKLTKEELAEYQENLILERAPIMLSAMMDSIQARLQMLDYRAADQTMEIFGMKKQSSGVVINNLMQNNNYEGDEASQGNVYFEKIIKLMEQRERPNSESEVIDVEAG